MEQPASSPNPYSTPTSVEAAPPPSTSPLRLALRWTAICGASAVPSFFYALAICDHPLQIPMIALGVLMFAFAYTMIAQSEPWRQLMDDRLRRGCVITAYGCRIGFSVFLPIGWANDLLFGMLSVQAVGLLFGNVDTLTNPWQILLTTILQGVLLNLEVFCAILLFIGVSRAYRWVRSPAKSKPPEPAPSATPDLTED